MALCKLLPFAVHLPRNTTTSHMWLLYKDFTGIAGAYRHFHCDRIYSLSLRLLQNKQHNSEGKFSSRYSKRIIQQMYSASRHPVNKVITTRDDNTDPANKTSNSCPLKMLVVMYWPCCYSTSFNCSLCVTVTRSLLTTYLLTYLLTYSMENSPS